MTLTTYTPLLWLALLIPLAYFIYTSLVTRPLKKRFAANSFRILAIISVILALCHPYFSSSSKDLHVVYLVDVSQSIDLEDAKKALASIEKNIAVLKANDSYSLYMFANGVKKISPSNLSKTLNDWSTKFADDEFRSQSSIGSALEVVKMVYPANKIKKLLLFSDGVSTGDKVLSSIASLKDEQIEISFSDLQKIQRPEISVVSLKTSTPISYRGEVVRMSATVLSNYSTKAQVKFISQGVIVHTVDIALEKDKEKQINFQVTSNETTSGIWEAEIAAPKDYFPINNIARCSLIMQGEAKVLALHKTPSKLRELKKALAKQGVSMDVRGKYGLPASLQDLNEFDAIMFANIEATSLSSRQMDNVRKYVTEFGGGLIMTGSENSFGLGGYYKTPIEEVLPVTSRYEKEKEQPSLALMLIIDKSGSMGGAPIALAREASKAAVELLSSRDQVAVIAFDGNAKLVSDLTSAANKGDVLSQIDGIGAGGGTNLYPAMAMGRDMLGLASSKIKHMIVLSDGQSQGGDFEGVTSELSEMGVTVSTVSLGQGAAVDLMAAIAQIGNGRAYVTNNAEEMPRIFTKETMEASRSAIKEEPFIPIKINDSDYLQGINIDETPLLLGYVMTKLKASAQIQLLTENGDPLLASGRYGLGQSVAFTSDTTELWAGEWLEWNNFGKFWAQVIRSIVRNKSAQGFTSELLASDKEMNLQIYRSNENGTPENHISWEATLMDNNGKVQPLTIQQTGFGTYQSYFAKPKDENYTIRLHDQTNNRIKTLSQISAYPKEYLLASNKADIFDKLTPLNDQSFTEKREAIQTQESALNIFALFALISIILSTLFRRI
ncbi:VWA domain-containing protein [Lentisphaera profundi]|uniref:VWA domain-containing protein n=1 Tax=Lentisphaera profundi TaxID=1658616 RepID=A0ABY7VYM4_9BACT|nr:VWA domain-containing protein [Lentisphaera profundi]WDE97962.1 VWA domain-containing protein [Lentisphaera profundi]